MPQLKNLSCSIQWADTGAPFQEYGTVYGDGLVESLIVVPNKPQLFNIRLKSVNFIHEGLSVIVFIDGNYQANRNRVNLKPNRKGVTPNRVGVDFLFRQREKPVGEGIYMGRDWRFDNHNIVESLPEGAKESHFDLLGTIEVLVLRCRSRVPQEKDESGSSSAADSDVLDEKGGRAVIDENEEENKPSNVDGAAEQEQPIHHSANVSANLDGTRKHIYQYGLDGDNGYYNWPTWNIPRPAHRRSLSQQHSIAQPLPNLTSYHAFPLRPKTPQTPQRASSQKRVRFDLGAQPVTPPYMPAPPRPPSYERTRQSTDLPSIQSNHVNSMLHGPPIIQHLPSQTQPTPHPDQHIGGSSFVPQHTAAYQQPYVLHPNYSHFPPPIPDHPPSQYPQPNPVHYLHPNGPFPHNMPFTHVPHPNSGWYTQPPHLVYNPYQSYNNLGWPFWPKVKLPQPPDASKSPTAVADASKDSNNGGNNQPSSNTGSNNTAMDWPNWDNKTNDSTANATTGNQGSQSNEDWAKNEASNDTQQTNNFDDPGTGNNDFQSSNEDQNDWGNGNNNNDTANTGGGGWEEDEPKSQPNGNNSTTDNTQIEAISSRALFGPHGQYYTFKPRGPDDPVPDAEEEPRYDVPKSIAESRGSSKQVLPGSGYMYFKKRRAPEYLDTMEEPYARFVFKYRTKEQLEKEIGIKIEVEPTGDQEIQELQSMEKQALIDMLIRAKSALGGKVPSPPPKPAVPVRDSTSPIPVDPPDHTFLKYKLPESRPTNTTTNTVLNSSEAKTVGGGTGGGVLDTWNAGNNNNNDNDNWNTNQNGNTGSSSNNQNIEWNDKKVTSNADPVNWNRTWDGVGEQQIGNSNNDSNDQWSGTNGQLPQQSTSPTLPFRPPSTSLLTPPQQAMQTTLNTNQTLSANSWQQNPTPWPSQSCGLSDGWANQTGPENKSAGFACGPAGSWPAPRAAPLQSINGGLW